MLEYKKIIMVRTIIIVILIYSTVSAFYSYDGISTSVLGNRPCANITKDGLLIQIVADRSHYSPGDGVRFKFQMTNVSGTIVKLYFPAGIRYIFEVYKDGRKIWDKEEGGVYLPLFNVYNMTCGETLSCEVVWDQVVGAGRLCEPGEYTAVAYIATSPIISTPEIRFVIEE